ncbi:hypothetical protein [Alkalicoccus urumqiensis]|uniref:Uncharacterized protein n=1 Tax=Alkalicoccus urumqiensis TaxID=1548213 RepID=A0A2P6MKV4_ALKUR|nr:hypothetical protein [Alkalicoccus urumqiensis]PRO66910.1 hypothetical protein C6I21_03025 [Alkalicoccus urumqiensis]
MNTLPEQGAPQHDVQERFIHFIEMISSVDLNSSWHEFALLWEDKSYTLKEEEHRRKARNFQIYYRDKLTYEGALLWTYPVETSGGLAVHASVRFDKIRRGDSSIPQSHQLEIDLMDYLSEDKDKLNVEVIQLPEAVSEYDRKRMHLILKKWGLEKQTVVDLMTSGGEELERFVQHIISAAILLQSKRHTAENEEPFSKNLSS